MIHLKKLMELTRADLHWFTFAISETMQKLETSSETAEVRRSLTHIQIYEHKNKRWN